MFVACQNKNTRGLFDDKPRLYAYPSIPVLPTKDEFIIIDSGAYALSQKGKEIDATYMFKLSGFYKKYGASNVFPILGIAPDKFLDPYKSMANYNFWQQYIGLPIVPVIQFTKAKKIDLYSALKQVDFYLNFKNKNEMYPRRPKIFAISNPSLTAKESKQIVYLIEYMRKQGIEWIHNLGAGWNTNDCKDWHKIGFDSIDSISYYTDAERGLAWKTCSYISDKSNLELKQLIINNYNCANERTI